MKERHQFSFSLQDKFKFPDDVDLSDEAKSLMKGLIADRKNRLTYEEIIAHPFFKGLDWNNLINCQLFIPLGVFLSRKFYDIFPF